MTMTFYEVCAGCSRFLLVLKGAVHAIVGRTRIFMPFRLILQHYRQWADAVKTFGHLCAINMFICYLNPFNPFLLVEFPWNLTVYD